MKWHCQNCRSHRSRRSRWIVQRHTGDCQKSRCLDQRTFRSLRRSYLKAYFQSNFRSYRYAANGLYFLSEFQFLLSAELTVRFDIKVDPTKPEETPALTPLEQACQDALTSDAALPTEVLTELFDKWTKQPPFA